MYIPKQLKLNNSMNYVSRKSVNRYLDYGLKVISAKPCLYFHQTLSFAEPITEATKAKKMFNTFMNGVVKYYKKHELSVFYVQERRREDLSVHFHVCFLFFDAGKLPFSGSRMDRDFRTDIYRRWDKLNDGKCAHCANKLVKHEFNLKSLEYFCQALQVFDTSKERGQTKRKETNWWGCFNKKVVLQSASAPTTRRIEVFNQFFKKFVGKFTLSPDKNSRSYKNALFEQLFGDLSTVPENSEEFGEIVYDNNGLDCQSPPKMGYFNRFYVNPFQRDSEIVSDYIKKMPPRHEGKRILIAPCDIAKAEEEARWNKFTF